ncbi:MAG: nitroreductase family protein [Lachnospiraceae bacterium]|nr:nitroreductase family protein [Lachnospiraceae bacterium]
MSKNILQIMKERRSVRKYTDKLIDETDLNKIIEAGLFAPNAGGGQRSMLLVMNDKELVEKVGRLNASCIRRDKLEGGYVSAEQPSIIDDPTIKSGFYGAPTVVAVFAQKNFLYNIPDAFCCAENMVLEAYNLGISSCIVARGEDTFTTPEGMDYLKKWNVPENMECKCFVLLGYIAGKYPDMKKRREGRVMVVTE